MRRKVLLMLAAVLTVCSATVLTSCTVEIDNPVNGGGNNNPADNTHKQQLTGAWYDIYEVESTTTAKSVTTKNDTVIQFAHVMDVYQFTETGVGSFRRYFFRDDSFEPIGMTGVTAATYASPFRYATTQERPMVEGQDMGRARIDMTLINAEVTETPDKWSVTYDDDNISATGLDGQQSVLIPASEELGKIIDSWGGEYAAAAAGAGIIDLEGISTLNWHGLLYLLEPNKQAAIIGVSDYNITDITVDSYRNMLHINIAQVYHINRVAIGAFRGLKHLRSINMADSGVQEIGPCAFKGCKSLVTATIPASCTVLGKEAYMNCTNLKTANMPGVNEMGESCFENCPSMTQLTLGREGLVAIPKRAFYGCRGLLSVDIPDCVVTIDDEAFRGCTGFNPLIIPKKVESIGDYAFEHCTSLITLTFLDNNVKFGKYAFANCYNLLTVTPGQFNTKIDDTVFEGCNKLLIKPKGI